MYLLGRCGDPEIARDRKRKLIHDFGLSEDMIRIHPDDEGDETTYGVTVLGSFIGTSNFVEKKLDNKETELKSVCESIITVHSKQIKFLMLQWCFSQMLIYWQRTYSATSNHDAHHSEIHANETENLGEHC